MKNQSTLVLHNQWRTLYSEQDLKPGLSRGFLNVVILWVPISLVIWAGIIYGASRLLR
jgi:hypothetical protein